MTEKELKKLSRAQLAERLTQALQENEELRAQLRIVGDRLADRALLMENAGSIAEAALSVNGVFEAAQAAAAQYLENIQTLSRRQEEICAKRDAESRRESERLLLETQRQCDRMKEDAQRQTQTQWQEISQRLEAFYQSHQGLRELIGQNRPYFQDNIEK